MIDTDTIREIFNDLTWDFAFFATQLARHARDDGYRDEAAGIIKHARREMRKELALHDYHSDWHRWPQVKPPKDGWYLVYNVDKKPGGALGTLPPFQEVEHFEGYYQEWEMERRARQEGKEDYIFYRVACWRELPRLPAEVGEW